MAVVIRHCGQDDRRFVDNGRVVCSAGIAAGIDMSLYSSSGGEAMTPSERSVGPY
jgi:hypothetical protein